MIKKLSVGALAANCYVVDDVKGNAIIVDPGGSERRIIDAVAADSLTVHAVFDTHGHFDHIGANDPVASEYGVQVHIHSADRPMLSSAESANPLFDSAETRAGDSPVVELSDGDTFEFGELRIEVLHTPGHTQGGVCLLVEGCGEGHPSLLTGDTLFQGSVGRSDLPGGDESILMRSIRERILSLDDSTAIHPGHGDSSTLSYERLSNPYVMLALKESSS